MSKVYSNAVYGQNKLEITLDGRTVKIPFMMKYGANTVPFDVAGRVYEIKVNPKYGKIQALIPKELSDGEQVKGSGLSNFADEVYTLINQIPTSEGCASKTAWKKHRLCMCSKQSGLYDKSKEQMFYASGAWTAFLHGWRLYKPPLWTDGGYYALEEWAKDAYFTVGVGDLLILSDIPEPAPRSVAEFCALKEKYKACGGAVTGCEVYINYKQDGTPWKTNHIEVIKS